MDAKTRAQYMHDLQAMPGWHILTKELTTIKNELESMILSGQYNSALEGDILRIKRMDITFLLDMPRKLSEMTEQSHPDDDTDPYLTREELEIIKKHSPS